jgi:hypothetical protein
MRPPAPPATAAAARARPACGRFPRRPRRAAGTRPGAAGGPRARSSGQRRGRLLASPLEGTRVRVLRSRPVPLWLLDGDGRQALAAASPDAAPACSFSTACRLCLLAVRWACGCPAVVAAAPAGPRLFRGSALTHEPLPGGRCQPPPASRPAPNGFAHRAPRSLRLCLGSKQPPPSTKGPAWQGCAYSPHPFGKQCAAHVQTCKAGQSVAAVGVPWAAGAGEGSGCARSGQGGGSRSSRASSRMRRYAARAEATSPRKRGGGPGGQQREGRGDDVSGSRGFARRGCSAALVRHWMLAQRPSTAAPRARVVHLGGTAGGRGGARACDGLLAIDLGGCRCSLLVLLGKVIGASAHERRAGDRLRRWGKGGGGAAGAGRCVGCTGADTRARSRPTWRARPRREACAVGPLPSRRARSGPRAFERQGPAHPPPPAARHLTPMRLQLSVLVCKVTATSANLNHQSAGGPS